MNKSINRSAKTVLRTLLVLALVLSLFCMSALAAGAPDYAHLEVGTANVTSLKAGDTVKIPVSLAGLKEDQYLSGISCNVAAMSDGYLTVTGVEFAPSISGWSGGYNAKNGSVNMVNLAFAEHPENSLHSNGLLFHVVCNVEQNIPAGTTTGITLSNVSMSQTSAVFLNSTDGTEANLDKNAVVYPNGGNGGGVSIPEPTHFTMSIATDKPEVEMSEIVTITITGKGGAFTGAAYEMTYDPTLFELVDAPVDAVLKTGTANTYRYLGVFPNGLADGGEISTYKFKALAQDAEVEGAFTLVEGECYIETLDSSLGGNAEPCAVSAPAKVKIVLKDDLTVSADDVTVDYDGQPHGVNATANKDGATIKYADADGEYTLDKSPAYTAVGEYTVKFRATLKGYQPATGEAKVTINQPKYFTETTEYVAGYSLVLVYTDYDSTRYTYDGNTMLDATSAGYTFSGVEYKHVYGWVVKGTPELSKIGYTQENAPRVAYSMDVNASGTTDLRDAVATVGVYNADARYMLNSNMAMILRADIDHNKKVDSHDYGAILANLR